MPGWAGVPGRVVGLFSAGVKSKTSDYFAACFGPVGTAMYAQLQDMPGPCRKMLIRLAQAAGDLYDKTPRRYASDQRKVALLARAYRQRTAVMAPGHRMGSCRTKSLPILSYLPTHEHS